jgi:hypothetical protein
MVQMFEPDEAAPLPYVLRMIAPADSLDHALRAFVFYEYYYYGFPYFAASALALLPVQWAGRIADLPLVMLVLRQVISVLPMLAALLILVYLQDGFRTYRSVVLYLFLLSIPAVFANHLWWHADSLTFLMVVLVFFFLARDDLRFGRNFILAAAFCGIATATKLVGLYFFLVIALSLLLGLLVRNASWKRLVGMAAVFIGVMALAFVIANPFLLSHWARQAYIWTLNKQTGLLAQGYGIQYAKGLSAAWPLIRQYYGEAFFLLVALAAVLWGILRGKRQILHAQILVWFLTVTVSLIWLTHFKYQYWLPAALPLFSCLIVLLPEKWPSPIHPRKTQLAWLVVVVAVAVQFAIFVTGDGIMVQQQVHRAEKNSTIQFYDQAVGALKPLGDRPLHVYYDYRLYVPETPGWTVETNYELLEYGYIQERNFDVLLLLKQRIQDYLNPNAVGIDSAAFARSQQFYRDADNGTIQGYTLVYRNDLGLVYVRNDPK